MTATLSMIPLSKIRQSDGDNPRSEFDDDQMAELTDSVKRHGVITPLTLAPDGDGRFTIIAGERRYRAAKAAKLREVPAQVREPDGETLTLAVAENVIRADLHRELDGNRPRGSRLRRRDQKVRGQGTT